MRQIKMSIRRPLDAEEARVIIENTARALEKEYDLAHPIRARFRHYSIRRALHHSRIVSFFRFLLFALLRFRSEQHRDTRENQGESADEC